MSGPWRGKIAVRLWLVGLFQLALVVLGALFVGPLTAHYFFEADLGGLREQLAPHLDDAEQLSAELRRAASHSQVEVSIFDLQNNLLATNTEPPLPAPRFGELPEPPPGEPLAVLRPPGAHHGRPPPGPLFLSRIEGKGREVFMVARLSPRTPGPWPTVLTLAFGILLVAAGFLLMTRLVTRPLNQLSRAVASFGAGDLSARAQLKQDDELGALGRSFNQMAERVQQLRRAEKELLANVAHELRTPLARVRVALDIAEESKPEEAQEILSEISTDLSELETLIDDVLTTARLELAEPNAQAAGFALHLEEANSQQIAEDAVARLRSRHPNRKIQLELEAQLPSIVVDPVLCRRVLSNLLENAHKYSPDASTSIDLFATRREDLVCFTIRDQGQGISHGDLEHIFTPFFRVEQSRTRAAGGVGLGLTLSQRIVAAHGGSITVESELNVGTQVQVTFPLQPPTQYLKGTAGRASGGAR